MPTGVESIASTTIRAIIIGTGAMAPGIAAEYARLGPTLIAGRNDAKIAAALDVARGALATLAREGLLDPDEATAAQRRLGGTTIDAAHYATTDVVVESI